MTENNEMTPDQYIARIASTQHGLVTREQVLAAGLSAESLGRRLKSKRLQKVGWRVYAAAGAERTWEQLALAACLDHGPLAALSHGAAAKVLGIDSRSRPRLHVTVPYGMNCRRRSRVVVLHRSRRLIERDRTIVANLPVTTVTRTLFDLAATLPARQLAGFVDAALANRIVSPRVLLGVIDNAPDSGRKGAKELRKLVVPWVDSPPDSVAECQLLRFVDESGFPSPVPHYQVSDGDTTVHVDLAWPEQALALELDGFRWHANPAAHARDRRRATWLAAQGWIVLRVTPTEVERSPDDVVAALSRHLVRRRNGSRTASSV